MFDDYDYNGEPLEINPCDGCSLDNNGCQGECAPCPPECGWDFHNEWEYII